MRALERKKDFERERAFNVSLAWLSESPTDPNAGRERERAPHPFQLPVVK